MDRNLFGIAVYAYIYKTGTKKFLRIICLCSVFQWDWEVLSGESHSSNAYFCAQLSFILLCLAISSQSHCKV